MLRSNNAEKQNDQDTHLTKSSTLYKIYGIIFSLVIVLTVIKNFSITLNWLGSVVIFCLQTTRISTVVGFYFSGNSLLKDRGQRMLAATHFLGYGIILFGLSTISAIGVNAASIFA